jgi:hypothetical protein
MPTLRALQHIFSSVERGYDPQLGRGFQTVAVAAELVGTEDLRALERAAFYTVSRERRAARDFPVKEAFFRLPSGRFALGRTVDWGTDSLGREGNYLTHHLILRRDDLLAAGGNPFALLDTARLAEPGLDLTPRALLPLAIEIAPTKTEGWHGGTAPTDHSPLTTHHSPRGDRSDVPRRPPPGGGPDRGGGAGLRLR